MKSRSELLHGLNGFSGTEAYHPLTDGVVLTDGAKYLFNETGTLEVAKVIAARQPELRKNELLRNAQFWELRRVRDTRDFTLTCTDGSGGTEIAFQQRFENLDMPLDEATVFCMPAGDPDGPQVILLPMEY